MKPKNIATISFILIAIGIAIGAIGAHLLKSKLSPACLATFETGAKYHLYISIIFLSISALSFGSRIYFSWSLTIVFIGFLAFVGGCYISAFREIYPQIGLFGSKLAPFGGIFLILGFLIMAIQVYRHPLK
jgi:uncharacterized membrane protein YgdD (TMEM256/DUF423 family)